MAAEIKEAVLSGGTFPSQYSVGCFCLDLSESLTSFQTMGLLSIYCMLVLPLTDSLCKFNFE